MRSLALVAVTGVLAGAPLAAHAADYMQLKGGGMALGGPGGTAGGYFGFELGRTAGWLDAGVSLDWYHRSSREVDLLFETDHGFEPPLRGERTRFQSSTDFVPLGLTLRVRIPTAKSGLVPFVSGTMAYEVLHLSFYDRTKMPRPYDAWLEDSQTLMGVGWQVAGGVEWSVARNAGLFGEAGVHWSDPSHRIDIGGTPVDLRASLHGGFLRAGLRVAL